MMNEVLKEFIEDDVDLTLLQKFDTERKQITFTQEQKNIYCAETKLLLKKNESSQEKKKKYIKYQLIIYQETRSINNILPVYFQK